MNYTNFNMRLDETLLEQVYPILKQYGLTPSQAVRMFFNQIAHTHKVPLSFDWAENNVLNAKAQARLRQTAQEFANGEFEQFDSIDELNKVIKEAAHG